MGDIFDDFDSDFDPASLAEEAVQSNLDPSVFEQIRDAEIRKPKNIIEWIRGKSFLNVKPFPKQIEICGNMYGHFCPRCTNPKFVFQEEQWGFNLLTVPVDHPLADIWDNVIFLEDGRCPKCSVTRRELISKRELNHYINLNGCAGMRSSKTVISGGLISTYQVARFLMLKSPAKYFSLMENQTLHSTFVAITAGQAKDTLWQAFKDRIDSAPWFKDYHAFLDDEAKRLGKEKFYDYKETFLSYDHKQLICSFCGPDIRTIRGRTRFNTAMDEKGWFDVQADSHASSSKVRMNAHETHVALEKSLRTIRSASMKLRDSGEWDPPDAFNCDVSSPSSLNDAIMVGLREANEDPTIYAFHYATWEMNPDITLDSLRAEMRDRKAFERDYGATPPLGANQFIPYQNAIEKSQRGVSQTKNITWTKRYESDDYGDRTMYLEVKPQKKDRTKPMILTVDTGLSNNSFAVTLWSFNREDRKPECEVALECMPEETEGERILVNFPLMFENCIVPLVSNFRVIMAVFDRWNSIDHVQRLRREHKVEAIQYVLKWADFQAIRATVADSNFTIPKMEVAIDDIRKDKRKFEDIVRPIPITHLALQILTVREGGRKVMKPINGTDDLFRCLCLAIRFILDPDYTRKFEQYGSAMGMGRAVVGVMRANYKEQAGVSARSQQVEDMNIGVRKGFKGRLT